MAAAALARSRVLVVGDVHGCVEELQLLLSKCGVDVDILHEDSKSQSEPPVVVLVGDLVGKGPHSVAVVKLVRRIGCVLDCALFGVIALSFVQVLCA